MEVQYPDTWRDVPNPHGTAFHLNRVLRNGERYISRISGITLALCKRCFLRVYYGRLKRLERRILALSEQRREVNDQLNASRRLLSYARRYAFRRRTLAADLGVQRWLGDSATTDLAVRKWGRIITCRGTCSALSDPRATSRCYMPR